ncbi:hypothetical protein EK0264_01455 [Epidermidibacterium keratini]|uniref:DUF998 domain-containing protein n=1 Tax=Epidermidibacterium keratini TaxID=1891644 RepID=A0A7L4YJV3_9ACTN|nr:hypothetical protein [Epidermidibacterium keratini]QHB99088.1 hypothetical protein EK0264_01455 [Epidermidibacterium keratini]
MVLIAFLLTWLGAGLLALTAFVLPYADAGGNTLASIELGQAVYAASDNLGLPTVLGYYAIAGYAALGGLLAATTLFAMFNSRANRWIAVLGYVVLAGLLGWIAWRMWSPTQARQQGETIAFYAAIVIAVLMLIFAFLAVRQRVWRVAIIGAVLALVGLGLSIWLMLSSTDAVSFRFYGWLIPLGYLLLAFGALGSIAAAGKERMNQPPESASAPPAAPSSGFGATPV